MKYGLLGKNSLSFSPKIHSLLGEDDYILFDTDNLDEFFAKRDFAGINVTVPYKEKVIKYCDELDSSALNTQAVNTIKNENGILRGYNTDTDGFEYMLSGIDAKNKKVTVIGSGGASKAVQYVLKQKGVLPVIVSRSGEIKEVPQDTQILINATPVGMAPDNFSSPADVRKLKNCEAVLDVIYNPLKTKLMLDASENGIKAIGGLGMLVEQARRAEEIFSGRKIPKSETERIISRILSEKANIVLIGMPGAGKTTVGELLAKKLEKEFVDTDRECEKLLKIKVADAVKNDEKAFRNAETIVIKRVSELSGKVIATGGGSILEEKNRTLLAQSGIIVYLKCDIDLLATEGRPLSSSREKLEKLFAEREGIYSKLATFEVQTCKNAQKTVENIQILLEKFLKMQ